jgi:hypothetical protein
MPPLSRDAIWTVLSGLTLLACDKRPSVSAEPAASTAQGSAVSSAGTVGAKEVPSAQGKAGDAEKSCAPGGCSPGQCGGSKK